MISRQEDFWKLGSLHEYGLLFACGLYMILISRFFTCILGLCIHGSIWGQDTLKYTSANGRYDCIIVNHASTKTYSKSFLQGLSVSKEATIYNLYDSTLVLDHTDTVKLPNTLIDVNAAYVSANICFHQRNYTLKFEKTSLDSYICTLDILTDYKAKSQQQFTATLQPSILIRNGTIIYKDRNSNLKIIVQANDTIVLENLFIDNQPCPRTIMFLK